MGCESCCDYNGSWWDCKYNEWADQKEHCYFAFKSEKRPLCMYMRHDQTCDNHNAQKASEEKTP